MNTLLAAISATQSLLDIILAAGISTAMLGLGLYGRRVVAKGGDDQNGRRRIRWLWIFGGIVGALMTLYVARVATSYGYQDSAEVIAVAAGVFVGLVLGLLMILVGVRGRWVGEHPHCRRCGFDLFGKPPESNICNECGADLAVPRSTTIGLRHRRLVPLLVGAFFLLVSAGVGVSVGSGIARSTRGFTLAPYKPTWWLVRDIRSNPSSWPTEASNELWLRMRAGTLSNETIETIVSTGEATHTTMFADAFAFEAWGRGKLAQPTMQRVLHRQFTFRSEIARESTPELIAYQVYPGNVYWWSGLTNATYAVTNRQCFINGIEMPASCVQDTPLAALLARATIQPFGTLLRLPAPLPAGLASVKVTGHVTVTLTTPGQPTLTDEGDATLAEGATNIQTDTPRTFDALAGPDRLMAATAATIKRTSPDENGGTHLDIKFATTSGSVFAGDAYLRSHDGVERKLGPILIIGGKGSISATLPPPALGPTFEIVLKPTNDLAATVVWTAATCQEEIAIPAPMITLYPPAAK